MADEPYLMEHGLAYLTIALIYSKSLREELEVHCLRFYFEAFVMALNTPHRPFLHFFCLTVTLDQI